MKNVSPDKGRSVAKTAGLLAVAALAITFFTAPMGVMGAGNQGQQPPILKGVKCNFEGLVNGAPPGTDMTVQAYKALGSPTFKLSLIKTMPKAALGKGQWIGCGVKDAVTNSTYDFTATVDTVDAKSGQVTVLLGTGSDPTMVAGGAAKRFQGKVLVLTYAKDSAGNITPVAGTTSSGWGAGASTM